jgi:hypothetical protein
MPKAAVYGLNPWPCRSCCTCPSFSVLCQPWRGAHPMTAAAAAAAAGGPVGVWSLDAPWRQQQQQQQQTQAGDGSSLPPAACRLRQDTAPTQPPTPAAGEGVRGHSAATGPGPEQQGTPESQAGTPAAAAAAAPEGDGGRGVLSIDEVFERLEVSEGSKGGRGGGEGGHHSGRAVPQVAPRCRCLYGFLLQRRVHCKQHPVTPCWGAPAASQAQCSGRVPAGGRLWRQCTSPWHTHCL